MQWKGREIKVLRLELQLFWRFFFVFFFTSKQLFLLVFQVRWVCWKFPVIWRFWFDSNHFSNAFYCLLWFRPTSASVDPQFHSSATLVIGCSASFFNWIRYSSQSHCGLLLRCTFLFSQSICLPYTSIWSWSAVARCTCLVSMIFKELSPPTLFGFLSVFLLVRFRRWKVLCKWQWEANFLEVGRSPRSLVQLLFSLFTNSEIPKKHRTEDVKKSRSKREEVLFLDSFSFLFISLFYRSCFCGRPAEWHESS